MRHVLMTLATVALAVGIPLGPSNSQPRPAINSCGRATVIMPSPKDHRDFLEENPRYGAESAKHFDELVRRFGPNILDYQIILVDGPGASEWFDVESFNGLFGAEVKTIKAKSCKPGDYPLAVLIGIEAKAIEKGELLVAKKTGNYDIISLRSLRSRKIIPARYATSMDLICSDIRSCDGISAHPKFRQ